MELKQGRLLTLFRKYTFTFVPNVLTWIMDINRKLTLHFKEKNKTKKKIKHKVYS